MRFAYASHFSAALAGRLSIRRYDFALSGFAAGAGEIFTTTHVTDAASEITHGMKTARPSSPRTLPTTAVE